jgi:hypothetical protein
LGWTDGRNVQIDIRFAGAGRVDPMRCNKRLTAVFDPDILVPSPDGIIG